MLHDAFVPHQVPADLRRAIVELETTVESTFNNFRGSIDGRRVDDNAIAEILRTSDDADERRAAWEASKQIGPEVADRIRELARLRNQAARDLGARDHFALALATGELDETRLFATLDDVDRRHRRAVRGVETRRRHVARAAASGAPSTTCARGTTTTRSSRARPPRARSRSTTSSSTPTSKR